MQESANSNSIFKINSDLDLEISFTDEAVDDLNILSEKNKEVFESKNLNLKTLKERIDNHLIPTDPYRKISTSKLIKTGELSLDKFYSIKSITGATIYLQEIENLSVIDIDLNHHKDQLMDENEAELTRNEIIDKCKLNNYVLAKTPSGGFHIYCNNDNEFFDKFNPDDKKNAFTQINIRKGLDLDLFTSRNPSKRQNILVVGSKIKYEKDPTIYQSEFINGDYNQIVNYSITDVLKELNWIETVENHLEKSKDKPKFDYEKFEDENYDKPSEEVQLALINGLDGLEIHNCTHTGKKIKDEISLMPLCRAINALNENLIEKAYKQVSEKCDLTEKADENFDKVIDDNWDQMNHIGCLFNIIKYHNEKYYNEKVLPLISGVHVRKFDYNDKFTILNFKSNARNGKYKTLTHAANDLLRFLRYHSFNDKYFIEKGSEDFENINDKSDVQKNNKIYSSSIQSRAEIRDDLKMIKLFKKDKKILTAWDAYVKFSDYFHFDKLKFFDKRSDTNFNIISYFHGFKYKKLESINYDLIDNYLRLIREGISDDNQELNEYIIKWIANLVQNPGIKNEVGLMLIGNQGTGKTVFTRTLNELFSGYSEEISDISELTGKYTTVVENNILLVANELSSVKDEFIKDMNSLKTIITEDTKRGREIYGKFHKMENISNLIFCSNFSRPIMIDNDDRRYCVIKVSNKLKRNFEFFEKLCKNRTSEFYDNLLTYFLSIDLTGFNPRDFPITEARKELIEACRSDSENIIVDNFDKFVNGIEIRDVKFCFENYYGKYDPKKFKIFQTEIKNKLKNEGNYRVALADGRKPTIYKLKKKFIEEYKPDDWEEAIIQDEI